MSKYRHLVEFCHWSIRVGGRVAEGRMKLWLSVLLDLMTKLVGYSFHCSRLLWKPFGLLNFYCFGLDTVKILFIALGMFINDLCISDVEINIVRVITCKNWCLVLVKHTVGIWTILVHELLLTPTWNILHVRTVSQHACSPLLSCIKPFL